ncbi:MAG: hypothetical protein K8U03_18845 [Planctomycetia bacterium]|nr:hypothetical protein [Planctomycetia bacterium]
MNALVLMLIPATLGVDFGWERQPDNSIEYIVQIEPEAVESMKTGTELISSLPPALRNIRDYRIRVGRDRLPNQNIIPPEINSNPAVGSNRSTIGNAPMNAPNNYPASTYTQNNGAFVNNSATPQTLSQQQLASAQPTQYNNQPNYNNTPTGLGPTTSNVAGMSNVTGTPTVPTSTSGFPLQTSNATYPATNYPTNTNNQYLGNLPPPPGTYPNNAYPAGSAQQPGYNQPAYNQPNYNTQPGYNNQPNYNNQPSYNQPGYPQQQTNPQYGQQPPQYLASNPGPAVPNLYGPGLGDPRSFGAAKPSITDPANPAGTAGFGNPQFAGQPTNGFPPGTQFTQPGANTMGTYPQGQFAGAPPLGVNPNLLLPNGQLAGNQPPLNPQFTNAANTENRSGSDPHQSGAAGRTTAAEQQSQWVSLTFTLVALFASIGANFYFGWTTYHLRERYRMMLVDRATY